MRALWRSILVCVVLGASGGATARAGVVGHTLRPLTPASQVVLNSSFSPIGANPTDTVWASGDYLLTTTARGDIDSTLMLTDDRTGTSTAPGPQCSGDALGPPWALMSCPSTSNSNGKPELELYSIAAGTSETVTPSPGVPQCAFECSDMSPTSSPDGVGAYWIRWDARCYHCADTAYFQSIQTGQLRDDPTNATRFADLNSPTLARSTCPGVRLLRVDEGYGKAWGPLMPYGQFALAEGNGLFLERCGTGMRRLLATANTEPPVPPYASNASEIVWEATPSRLNGLFLPSLQTFTIPLPSAMVTTTGLSNMWLTSTALYARVWVDGMVWRTASPSALPFNTSRPGFRRSSNTVTCMRGSWRNALGFSYAWRVNGVATSDVKPRLIVGKARERRSVRCSVTASNPAGTTTAASGQLHVR